MTRNRRSGNGLRLLRFWKRDKVRGATRPRSRSPPNAASVTETSNDPPPTAIVPPTTENPTIEPETYFASGEDPFETISISLRDSSVPTSLGCFLVVELNGEKGSDEQKFRTELLDLEWQKPIPEFYRIANGFAESRGNKADSKASYLVSVGYTIYQQRSPHQTTRLTRAKDAIEREEALAGNDPSTPAQTLGYRYDVHSTNTLTNPQNWEAAWNETFPRSVAQALLDVGHAVYIVEVKFRYQIYSEHMPSSCKGGRQCFDAVIEALNRQSATTYQRDVSFIPTRFFRIYFTQDVINHILSHCNDGTLEWELPRLDTDARAKFVEHVSNFGTRLLATCIYAKIGLTRLYNLYEAGLRDVNLPLIKDDQRPLPDGDFMIPDWPENERDLFYDQQFRFCAHHFQSRQDDEKLLLIKNRVIMPFLEKESIPESSQGSSADVFYVQIHGQHHEFSNDRSQLFAVKSFKKQKDEDFKKEKAICQELALYPHDHLTPYLTAWEDSMTFNILFPKAESDLHAYLMHTKSPDNMSQKLPWFLDQMWGLSEGLASIHRLGASHAVRSQIMDGQSSTAEGRQRIVCHHDLKPSNILVFRDRQGVETMKISDFGLAKVKERKSREVKDPASPRTRARVGTWEYMSPEKTLTSDSSRPSDVWSLGCIFLVMLLWFFGNFEDLEQFRASRAKQPTQGKEAKIMDAFAWYEFWHLPEPPVSRPKHDDPEGIDEKQNYEKSDEEKQEDLKRVVLKTAVQDKFGWLKTEAKFSKKGVLIDLVELVSLDMLTPDPVARKCAPAVCSELKNFAQRAERNINDPGNRVSKILSTGASTVAASTDIGDVLDSDFIAEDISVNGLLHENIAFDGGRLEPEQILNSTGGQFSP